CTRCRAWRTESPRGARARSAGRTSGRARTTPPRSARAGVDRGQRPRRALLERVVDLAIERDRGGLGQVVVDRRLLALVLEGAGVLVVQVLDCVGDALALVEQALPEQIGVERAHELAPSSRRA